MPTQLSVSKMLWGPVPPLLGNTSFEEIYCVAVFQNCVWRTQMHSGAGTQAPLLGLPPVFDPLEVHS